MPAKKWNHTNESFHFILVVVLVVYLIMMTRGAIKLTEKGPSFST